MDDIAFLESAYARTLGRAVDPRSLRDALGELAAGETRDDFLRRLKQSDEALARSSGASAGPSARRLLAIGPARRFVETALAVLGARSVDPEEVERHVAHLARHGDRRAWLQAQSAAPGARAERLTDVHWLELDDDEFEGRTSADLSRMMAVGDAAFVHLAYWRLLGRAPDPGARRAWADRLAAGARREDLLHQLIASAEGRQRGARLDGLGASPSTTRRLLRRTLTAINSTCRRLVHRAEAPHSPQRAQGAPR